MATFIRISRFSRNFTREEGSSFRCHSRMKITRSLYCQWWPLPAIPNLRGSAKYKDFRFNGCRLYQSNISNSMRSIKATWEHLCRTWPIIHERNFIPNAVEYESSIFGPNISTLIIILDNILIYLYFLINKKVLLIYFTIIRLVDDKCTWRIFNRHLLLDIQQLPYLDTTINKCLSFKKISSLMKTSIHNYLI